MDSCYRHPGRETGRRCTRCGRPACTECLRQASVGSHCVECVGAAQPSRREKVRYKVAIGTPYATYTLIAINVLMFFVAPPNSQRWVDLGVWGVGIDILGETYRIVTGAFLHGGVMHIGFNMLLLYQLGSLLERTIGLGRFVGLYSVSLLGGSVGILLVSPPNAFTIGASGAVYGLMGATIVIVRNRGGDIWSSGLGGLLLINVMITFIVPNISVGGHFGGLVAGAAAGWMLDTGTRTTPARLNDGLAAVFSIGATATLFVGAIAVAG